MQRLSNASPYLLVLALPGSFLLMPALIWWQARKRNQRLSAARAADSRGAEQTAQNP